ncbi:MAG TPA: hypothetical protein VM537_35240 [Anaerolineae bacterium]|nr:hypothetical protein [Anaerolineae bacterium]
MPIKTLDAIVLACLPEVALVQRVAALWCRAFKGRYPETRDEVTNWVEEEFGPVIDPDRKAMIARELIDEVKRQLRIRKLRSDRDRLIDPLTTPLGGDSRLGSLLNSRLGPARLWVSQYRLRELAAFCAYIDGAVYSGLVAGLIPVQMRLRRFLNPCLLVYRQGFSDPQSYWVPGHITTVADAFIWVIPPEAADFLQLEGTRVEHIGEDQAVRLFTPFGSKVLPWRSL